MADSTKSNQLISFWHGTVPYPELEPFFNTLEDPSGAHEEITNTAYEEGCVPELLDDLYLGEGIHPEAYNSSVESIYSELRGFRTEENPGPVFDEKKFLETHTATGVSVMAGLGYRMPTLSEVLAKYQTYNNWVLYQAEKAFSRNETPEGVYFDGFGVENLSVIPVKDLAWSCNGSLKGTKHQPYGSTEIQTFRDRPWMPLSGRNVHWDAMDFGDPVLTVEQRITTLQNVGGILRFENIQGPLTLGDCTFYLGETLTNDLFHRSDGTPFGRWSGLPRVVSDHMYVLGDKEVKMLSEWHPLDNSDV